MHPPPQADFQPHATGAFPAAPLRHLTDADVEALASHLTEALVQRLSDRRTVESLTDAWGSHVDRALGRGLRRIGAWVLMVLLGVAALKFDLLARLVAGFKP